MKTDQSSAARIAYLVHDVDDAAVRRRVDLFSGEGIEVGLGGFRRHAPMAGGGASPALDLGRTQDARLMQRAISVMKWVLKPGALRQLCSGSSVIVARNLEMLVLAVRVRSRRQRLVYECLDIHRLMLGNGRNSRIMRWVERRLLAQTDLVVVSSPAFQTNYFAARQGRDQAMLLVENKVPAERIWESSFARETQKPAADPGKPVWTIGWFGMLRCRTTLEQLAHLATSSQGRIQVIIAGIPSKAEFPDFSRDVAACPHVQYLGPFKPGDLPKLYSKVDFVWAIDYFEEGLNSQWLLPNRLYEGLANGVVPIALRSVETGRWLIRSGVGLVIDDPITELPRRLREMKSGEYQAMRQAIAALPDDAVYQSPAERRAIVAAMLERVDA